MKKILFTLALLIFFSSFGQVDVDPSSERSIINYFQENHPESLIEGYWSSIRGDVYIIKRNEEYIMYGASINGGRFEDRSHPLPDWITSNIKNIYTGTQIGTFKKIPGSKNKFIYEGFIFYSCPSNKCRRYHKEMFDGFDKVKKVGDLNNYQKFIKKTIIVYGDVFNLSEFGKFYSEYDFKKVFP